MSVLPIQKWSSQLPYFPLNCTKQRRLFFAKWLQLFSSQMLILGWQNRTHWHEKGSNSHPWKVDVMNKNIQTESWYGHQLFCERCSRKFVDVMNINIQTESWYGHQLSCERCSRKLVDAMNINIQTESWYGHQLSCERCLRKLCLRQAPLFHAREK